MSRPLKGPRLVKIKGKENWYIRDGRGTQFTTSTQDRECAEAALADYVAKKAMPDGATIAHLLDTRIDALRADKKSRATNNIYHHKVLKKHWGSLTPDQISVALIHADDT